MTIKIPVTQHLKSHLAWWTNSVNRLKGKPLLSPKINVTVSTDASDGSFGGHIKVGWTEYINKFRLSILSVVREY
jgi:hypothetical protein